MFPSCSALPSPLLVVWCPLSFHARPAGLGVPSTPCYLGDLELEVQVEAKNLLLQEEESDEKPADSAEDLRNEVGDFCNAVRL